MYLLWILRAGAIATLYLKSVECLSCVKGGVRIRCSAFVVGTPPSSSVAWKRTRGSRTAIAPAAALSAGRRRTTTNLSLTASRTGSFTASSAERRFQFGVGLDKAERQRYGSKRNCRGASMLGIEFHPPDWDTLVGAFAQAAIIGIVTGGLIPMWTRERILEKEAGLDVDERYEMGLDEDDYDDLGGYVCATCGNSNEVECPKCRGKGFFVSESAMPRKCDYCGGLGTVECPDCEDRRERLRKERARRRPPLRLPPGRDNDFPSIR